MTELELSRAIRGGSIEGAYFFYGDEDYIKNIRAGEIKGLLSEDERAFNLFDLFYGDGECDLGEIEGALSAPVFLSSRKVIIISFSSLDSIKDKVRERFLSLIGEKGKSAGQVLVIKAGESFNWGSEKQPSAFLKAMMKVCEPVRFDFQAEGKLAGWLIRHCGAWGVTLSQGNALELIRICGRSMYRLSNEAAKISAYAASLGRGEISAGDIRVCASSNDEDDAFMLVNAIAEGNTALAYHCIGVKKRLRVDPYMLLGQIERGACDLAAASAFALEGYSVGEFAREMKLNPYRAGIIFRNAKAAGGEYVLRMVELCRRADILMKTSVGAAKGYGEIEKLVGLLGK